MFRLVKDGEFESPQEAAWLFCAGELPIDRARELADHWLAQGLETEALIRFLVDCQDEIGQPAWREQRSSFKRALESLGATLWSKDQALIRIAVRQNEQYIEGLINRSVYLEQLYKAWFNRGDGAFLSFLQQTGLNALFEFAFEFSDAWLHEERPDLVPEFNRDFDRSARDVFETIRASEFER